MDPLSITASVLTLADAVAKIYRFLQSIHHADAGYAGLCTQLRSLTALSESIARTLQDCQRHPMALAHIDQDVWKQSRNAISDSHQAIDDLNALVKRIGGLSRSNSIFGKARIATKMEYHTREIVAFRDKIRMSNLSLQTLLQVINVSLSLRGNTSQTMILRELEQLKQYLEDSNRATMDNNPLVEIDKSDAHVLQNLKNLVRAAGDFQASASTKASTIFSGSQIGTGAIQDDDYDQSNVLPTVTLSKRRHSDLLRWRNRLSSRVKSVTHSGKSGRPTSLEHTNYPEVVACYESGLGQSSNLDSIFSGGLSKMAQKALRRFDFPQAEKILLQALGRHRISSPDDAHHSRLRTQLAICSFLQGRGPQIEEAIIDLVEFRGTKRPVAHQLLYNLALSHVHELNFEAAQKICSRLWESQSDFPTHLRRNDLLRLLVVSYRMSGNTLLAEAIEEQHPELAIQADDGLPSMVESLITCKELLVEFFGAEESCEIPRLFLHQLQTRAELAKKTPLELSRIKQQKQKAVDPGRSAPEINDRDEDKIGSSSKRAGAAGASSNHDSENTGRFKRFKTLLERQRSRNEAESDVSVASSNNIGFRDDSVRKVRVIFGRRRSKTRSYVEGENEASLWSRLAWYRRKIVGAVGDEKDPSHENDHQILSWIRRQDINALRRASTVGTATTAPFYRSPTSLRRHFSFTDMPSTPSTECRQPRYLRSGRGAIAELPNSGLSKMMATSTPALHVYEETSLAGTDRETQRYEKNRGTAPASIPVRTYELGGSLDGQHGASELESTTIKAPGCRPSNLWTSDRIEAYGCYKPRVTLAPDEKFLESLSEKIVINPPRFGYDSNERRENETQRSDISTLNPMPNRFSLRQKRTPLLHMSTDTREQMATLRPMSMGGSLARSQSMMGSSRRAPMVPGGVVSMRSRLRSFTQGIRKLQKRNPGDHRRGPFWGSTVHGTQRSKVHVNDQHTCGIKQKVHPNGLLYEYFGPTARPGPYTVHYHESYSSPDESERAVPSVPDRPGDIVGPVELDSRPITTVRYAKL